MARWKLTEAHYLRVDGTKWEYSEVDRRTGRPKRTQFDVPLYINPNYEDDLKAWGQGDTEVEYREIIVSDGNNAQPKDVIFIGEPTPGMTPLDDEAKAISKKLELRWNAPNIEGLNYSQRLELDLINQMAALKDQVTQAPPANGLAEMMAAMTAMMKQQTEILSKLADRPSGQVTRRVA